MFGIFGWKEILLNLLIVILNFSFYIGESEKWIGFDWLGDRSNII